MRGLEYAVALGGLCDYELLLGRGDPDDPEPSRGGLKRGRSWIVPDLWKKTERSTRARTDEHGRGWRWDAHIFFGPRRHAVGA